MENVIDINVDTENTETTEDVFETGWANPPTVADLKQDLTESSSDHDSHVIDVDKWLNNLNIEGSAKKKKVKGRSSIQPKLIRKQAEWRYAALSEPFLSTNDLFNTAPVTYEDKKSSIQNGLVLNNQFNTKLQKVKFIDELVRTVVDEGTAVVRTGWDYEDESYMEEVPDYQFVPTTDPAVLQQYQQIQQIMQSNNPAEMEKIDPVMVQAVQMSQQTGIPVAPIQVGSHMEEKTRIIKNQPTIEICNYNNVIIDPTCMGDMDKAEFVIYSFETNLSELRKDKRYKNLELINTTNNSVLNEPDHASDDDTSFTFNDDPRKKFVAYEYWGYWDVNGTGIVEPFVATWVGSVMVRMEDNPFPDKKLPFTTMQYLPVRREIYGEPDGELLIDNQDVVGAVTRGMIDVMGRSANGQMGSRKDALDVTNKRKFDRGLDYEFNAQVDPRQAFYMHTFPEIPQSAGLMLQLQNQEAESLSGVKAFSQGINSRSLGDNVGGIKSAMDATAKREMAILRRVAEGVVQVGRKIVSMNAEFLSDKEVIRVTNEEFIEVRRDDLAGNFDLTLTISTPEADNEKAQELSFMLQTLGPNQDPELTKMIQVEIARLRNMPDLARQIETYEPQPDPIEQEKRQLENEKLKA
ncbi:MAG: chromosome partitioning protein ParB, partial [Gammaproteobacteria bacterium]